MTTSPSGRPLRRDARDNRDRMLVAALELLGEREPDLSLRELAEHVGVGVGTAYRHFPTADDLTRATYDHALERLVVAARTAPEGASAWDRLVGFLEAITFAIAEMPGLRAVMRRMHQIDPDYAPARPLSGAIRELVAEAQQEGTLRPDVRAGDLAITPFALGGLIGHPTPNERAHLRRQLGILVDGLRAERATADLPPAEMSPEILHRFVHRPNGPPRVEAP